MKNLSNLSREYPHDEEYMKHYVEYQKKHAVNIRESDKVIINLINENLSNNVDVSLLDIGCSTGNLLIHIGHFFPAMKLFGCDLSDLQIKNCQDNSKLSQCAFQVEDITKLTYKEQFDFIIVNAVFYALEDGDFLSAATHVNKALKPGGILIAFDYFHPWKQELTIIEKSGNIPGGHVLHFRSYKNVKEVMSCAGFKSIEFERFNIKIDLPQPHFETNFLETYTVPVQLGERLQLRGVINQPWNHMIARK
jgi:SAM-dependent methyltransferase